MNAKIAARLPFQGLLQIVRFNWPMYVVGVLALVALTAILLMLPLPQIVAQALVVLSIPGLFWMLMSLVASYWIYDRSRLCRWDWIAPLAPAFARSLLNIHAGFDESSDALAELFPNAQLRVLDIFDEIEMSEPSIARARRYSPSRHVPEGADFRKLNVDDNSADLVTLLLAAHEIREPKSRHAFFQELHRILASDGRIILAEHLRDLPNFLAFGPGFMHFHSRRTWRAALEASGLWVEKEFSITPFVRIFVIRRKP